MSFDRQLEQICTHQVTEEALFLSADRRTVKPLRPIASSNAVKVRINGLADVSPAGLLTPALAKGSLPGPYDIRPGVNDTLVVSVNAGAPQTVTLPAGRSLSAKQLALILSRLVSGVSWAASKKNQVQAKSYKLGRESRLMFHEGSTLAPTLGLTLNRAYRGQVIVPSWSLIKDPRTLSSYPSRWILFDEPINGTNDYFEIDYITLRQECRRCGGSGVENDWRYDTQGEIIEVRNSDLLLQETLKVTYTIKGTNPFHLWYGTGLLEMIGKKISDRGLIQNLVLSDLHDAFRRWQNIKKQQEEEVGQFVSDEEYPFRLLVVNLDTDDQDPTILYVNALVQNRSNQPIQVSRGLKLPIPFDILGSTVQETLLREQQARTLGS